MNSWGNIGEPSKPSKDWIWILCIFLVGLIALFLISCTNSYSKDDTGREYYETTQCVKSHSKTDYGYHYGYYFGKIGFHWGYQCFYTHSTTICDSSITKRIYKE